MELNLFLRDVKRSLAGVFAMGHYWMAKDDIAITLSQFSSSSTVREGQLAKFEIVLANNASTNSWVRLMVDIYLKDNQTHPEGHYAYFDKHIYLWGQASQRLEVFYDWAQNATFVIDGVPIAADNIWRGACRTTGTYLVRAILLTNMGEPYEELAICNRLAS
jgi:hypothetical protein